ncbi:hypothetical protein AC812_14095 [Bellilinea caldifistulae]|uniref:Uncharacterized protein n=1 Tax=Bellilinea caldifistulae TaxID=360411 RepID=A0A0P6WZA5_9CHLR|nr:hypothetical protein AC812_14095 [Bellilinea caldifistulae]
MLPMAGPSNAKITITTTATRTRINAYSTRPWAFSFGANSIYLTSLLFKIYYLNVIILYTIPVKIQVIFSLISEIFKKLQPEKNK